MSCGRSAVVFILVTTTCLAVKGNNPPLCDASGHCFENATIPSPRTEYSTRTKQQLSQWPGVVVKNQERALQFAASPEQNALIFLGDSIFESYLGTSFGKPIERAEGVGEVMSHFAIFHELSTLVLAVSGDQTQHLLWRLQSDGGGEMPATLRRLERATIVLLIGTNNLAAGYTPADVALGVLAVVDFLLLSCRAKRVVVLALLPRGDELRRICPPKQPRCSPFAGSFLPAVDHVNAAVKTGVEARAAAHAGHERLVSFVDCGAGFRFPLNETNIVASSKHTRERRAGRRHGAMAVSAERSEVDIELMPDKLHPNAAGHKLLLNCLAEKILTRAT